MLLFILNYFVVVRLFVFFFAWWHISFLCDSLLFSLCVSSSLPSYLCHLTLFSVDLCILRAKINLLLVGYWLLPVLLLLLLYRCRHHHHRHRCACRVFIGLCFPLCMCSIFHLFCFCFVSFFFHSQFRFGFARIVSILVHLHACASHMWWSHLEIGVATEWFQIGYLFNIIVTLMYCFLFYFILYYFLCILNVILHCTHSCVPFLFYFAWNSKYTFVGEKRKKRQHLIEHVYCVYASVLLACIFNHKYIYG